MFLSTISAGTASHRRSTFDSNQCNDPSGDPSADGGAGAPSGTRGSDFTRRAWRSRWTSSDHLQQPIGQPRRAVRGRLCRPEDPGRWILTNVTLANNRSFPGCRLPIPESGGGLWIDEIRKGTSSCTIVGNEAQFGAGIVGFSSLTIDNSIFSNRGLNLFNSINCTDLGNPNAVSLGSHDLQWPADDWSGPDWPCAPGITFADPMLGELLRDPSSSTSTMAPQAGSPALAQGQGCPTTISGEAEENAVHLGCVRE